MQACVLVGRSPRPNSLGAPDVEAEARIVEYQQDQHQQDSDVHALLRHGVLLHCEGVWMVECLDRVGQSLLVSQLQLLEEDEVRGV